MRRAQEARRERRHRQKLAPLTDKLQGALRDNGGMGRSTISSRLFKGNREREEIDAALALQRDGKVRHEKRFGRGRPVEFWLPV